MTMKIAFNRYRFSKRELFKKENSSSERSTRYKRWCPNCGSHNFRVLESRFSRIFGQKNKCDDCGFVFKRPATERVKSKRSSFSRRRE